MKRPTLPNASSMYGARMGRPNTFDFSESHNPIKFNLYRMPMVDGDYDQGGAYWGGGNPTIGWMYHAYGEGEKFVQELFIRATSRDKAKEEVRKYFPKARFYR